MACLTSAPSVECSCTMCRSLHGMLDFCTFHSAPAPCAGHCVAVDGDSGGQFDPSFLSFSFSLILLRYYPGPCLFCSFVSDCLLMIDVVYVMFVIFNIYI